MEQRLTKENNILSDYYLLRDSGRHLSSLRVFWIYLINRIFSICFYHKKYYSSSEEAIVNFFLLTRENREANLFIHELYIYVTLMNYDNSFPMFEMDFKNIHEEIDKIIKQFESNER